jgi:hypothetical protein
MKKIIAALFLISLAFSFSTAQKKIKQVSVSSKTMARQPAGKAYSLDLTRKGTIYTLAPDVDYSRVQVRTSKGEMTMAELLTKAGKSGRVRVGLTSDIRTQKLNLARVSGGGALNFNCEGLLCTCTGDEDCNDMFTRGGCGDIAVCDERGCACLRI